MAISMGGGGADAPIGEMNTTPLIDVMLVLLIMFIITLPIQTHAVKIDLPVPPPENTTPPEPPVQHKIFIGENGTVTWDGTPVSDVELANLLTQVSTIQPAPEIQFEPHPNSRYIVVDRVLAVIKRTGVGNLGFVGNNRYGSEF
jgi:biopolymer transport protein ExbD